MLLVPLTCRPWHGLTRLCLYLWPCLLAGSLALGGNRAQAQTSGQAAASTPTSAPTATPASALHWQQTRVELQAPDPRTGSSATAPTTTAASPAAPAPLEARFAFRNTGSVPVQITSLQSDCGCTTAELTQRRYAPGEGGEILTRFTVGERVGRHEKHVLVQTSESKEPTLLTLVATIPELVCLQPAALAWSLGENAGPPSAATPPAKTLLLTTVGTDPLKHITANSSQALFTPTLRTLEEGRRYELSVTPARTDVPLVAQVPISCEFASGFKKVFTANVSVGPVPVSTQND